LYFSFALLGTVDRSTAFLFAVAIASHWRVRDDRYSEIRFENAGGRKVEMSHIG
jgi:hypothetical protein